MVLGRKTNPSPRSATSIQTDYLITIQQIKPWPPSPLLGSLRSVLIQWENGESSCGFTRSVVPVPKSSSIEFNESFHLPLTLQKDMSSTKPPGNAAFSKNNLVLNLYEPPRRDNNITKGKLIATAMIDLADYGVVEEALRIRAALNCKRSFRNMVQPFLYVDILPAEKARSCGSLSKELRLTEIDFESVADSMINDEYAEEAFSSSASAKYRRGFPTRNRQVNSTDEIFLQKSTRMDTGDAKNGEDGYEEHHYLMEEAHSTEDGVTKISAEADRNPGIGAFSFSWGKLAVEDDVLTNNIQEHVKSVKSSSSDTAGSNGNRLEEEHEHGDDGGSPQEEQVARQQRIIRDTKTNITDRRSAMSDAKVQHLQRRIQMLEGELREAAAMEVALYSVVAEHGNSASKTHAPARRLSRLYRHALSQSLRASAARSALSGLVLVAKACGNDVPRLTFWLSNSIMLRAILSPAIVKKKSSQQSFLSNKSYKNDRVGDHDKDEELENFIADIEKIEAWIFSRIVESIWWQILIPHMQSTAARRINRGKRHGSDSNNSRRLALAHAEEQAQADISLGIWKAAFKDACERLCPVRARGQACGCLSLPAQLIMEQCVARLDVAMFNALLRESDDDIPTDPISDPISDPKVLPIPAGKLSFRAGAQLKNVIGNWSRWLTDLLGIDSNESDEDVSETQDTPFRSFRLLYALSDLMMLPKDLLLNQSTRKEVCPTFGALLILRVLENFVPDEFCPEPVPEEVLEALIHEDPCECGAEELLNMYPCIAATPVYLPPSAASISVKSQQKSDGSLMKSQSSDDELDQVSSPLALISIHASSSSPISTLANSLWKEAGNRNACRYELLRDIWMDCE